MMTSDVKATGPLETSAYYITADMDQAANLSRALSFVFISIIDIYIIPVFARPYYPRHFLPDC